MKINLKFVLPSAALAFVLFAADRSGTADDRRAAAFPKQSFQAKLEYCNTCHGLSGQGYYGYFAMPRLAGQQPKYLENQLRAFVERRRTNPVMFNVAHALSPCFGCAFRGSQSKADGWRSEGACGNRKSDLPNGAARRQCAGVFGLPRSGGQRARGNSAARRSAFSVHRQGVDKLEQGAGPGVGK